METILDSAMDGSIRSFVTWDMSNSKFAETINKMIEYDKSDEHLLLKDINVSDNWLSMNVDEYVGELFDCGFPADSERMIRYILEKLCSNTPVPEIHKLINETLNDIEDYTENTESYYIKGATICKDGEASIVGISGFDGSSTTAMLLDEFLYKKLPDKLKKGHSRFCDFLDEEGLEKGFRLMEKVNAPNFNPENYSKKPEETVPPIQFNDKVFVTTELKEDEWAREQIELRGGIYKPRFVVSLDYLVCQYIRKKEIDKTVKLTKAEEQIKKGKNIRIITFKEFKEAIENDPIENRQTETHRAEKRQIENDPIVEEKSALKQKSADNKPTSIEYITIREKSSPDGYKLELQFNESDIEYRYTSYFCGNEKDCKTGTVTNINDFVKKIISIGVYSLDDTYLMDCISWDKLELLYKENGKAEKRIIAEDYPDELFDLLNEIELLIPSIVFFEFDLNDFDYFLEERGFDVSVLPKNTVDELHNALINAPTSVIKEQVFEAFIKQESNN